MGKLIPRFFTEWFGQKYLHRKGKVLFISQPLFKDEGEVDTLDYFCQMLASLAIHIDEVDNYDMVIKIPKSIDAWSDQVNFLIECKNNSKEYDLVIISPYDRKRILEHIINLQKVNNKLNVFTIDKGYTDKEFEQFSEGHVDPPKYIQADWEHGGELAAEKFIEYIVENHSDKQANCQILVVKGNDCHERENAFIEKIKKYSNMNSAFDAKTTQISGNFLRDTAYTETKNWILKNMSNIIAKPLYGVFACNDEMALGVRQAIIEIESESNPFQDYTPQIIGFDGIKDVVLRIKENDKYLYGTINIKVDKQVKELVELIKRLHNGISITQPNHLKCEFLKRLP